jgi:hypothetical protein
VHERTFTLDECEVQKYVVRRTDWAKQQQGIDAQLGLCLGSLSSTT